MPQRVTRPHTFTIMACVLVLALFAVLPSAASQTLRIQLTGLGSNAALYIRDQVIPEFEEKHGVKVEIERVDWPQLMEKLLVSTVAGIPPDVYVGGTNQLNDLLLNGLIYPIDELWHAWDEADDFYPPTLSSSTFEGVRYGVPLYTDVRVWWYHKSLFEESGLSADQTPATWDDLLTAARRLTRYDGDAVVQMGYNLGRFNPGDPSSAFQDFLIYLWQAGGDAVDPVTFKASFNSAAGLEAFDFLLQLRDTVVGPAVSLPADAWNNLAFARRASAISLAGAWVQAPLYQSAPELVPDVAAFDNLEGPAGPAVAVFNDWLGIHPDSQNKELAWEFIQQLTGTTEHAMQMHMINGSLSPRISTVPDFVAVMPLSRYMYQAMSQVTPPMPPVWDFRTIGSDWHIQWTKALQGVISPQEALNEAARLWDARVSEVRGE